MPTPQQLARFRQAIDHDASELKRIADAKEFKKYFGVLAGDRVKTAPQGYSRDHPEIELLRLKQVMTVHHLSDEAVLSPRFASRAVRAFQAMKPFLDRS